MNLLGSKGDQVVAGPKGNKDDPGSFPSGTAADDVQYWNGTQWVMIPIGANGQTLTCYNGRPIWGPCPGPRTATDIDGNVYRTVAIGNQIRCFNGIYLPLRGNITRALREKVIPTPIIIKPKPPSIYYLARGARYTVL